jgi:hypothetical protein
MVFDLEGRVLLEETLVGNVKYALPLCNLQTDSLSGTHPFILLASSSSSDGHHNRFEGIEFL